ncbi:hypothetical protein PVAR5_0438 [Paecilomyces variotii No. 5]|uniref:Uncharacterized protein n=1 Tax=Byssochlamys spectabilis (strain No. 5 / NBRC 109023) TaxID=1356009 RepID=V5FQJ7_BYSSN|nr:hypothetical protein PVAR5_0438 [Paecilomyces variotii No. 5]
MSSSITTAVPSGLIKSWCLADLADFDNKPQQCANETLGQKPSDFQTICCDGDIIDTTQNLWQPYRKGPLYLNIDNLVCCRLVGAQQGGIQAIDPDQTHCTAGSPTPLASLAATNTKNAADYLVTYTSASYGETTTGDFIPTETPRCLWMNTNTAQSNGVGVQTVTVPAARISTLAAATTDMFGMPIATSEPASTSQSYVISNQATNTGISPSSTYASQTTQASRSGATSPSSQASSGGSLISKPNGLLMFCLWAVISNLVESTSF